MNECQHYFDAYLRYLMLWLYTESSVEALWPLTLCKCKLADRETYKVLHSAWMRVSVPWSHPLIHVAWRSLESAHIRYWTQRLTLSPACGGFWIGLLSSSSIRHANSSVFKTGKQALLMLLSSGMRWMSAGHDRRL